MPYTVVRDTREKIGKGWNFKRSQNCSGTVLGSLKSGDYTLRGLESIFVIERKGLISEFAHNLFDKRFEAELERLELIEFPFVLLEFTMEDLIQYPVGSGIPARRWKYLKIKGPQLLKRFIEFQLRFKSKFIFVGEYGQQVATSIFKRIVERVNSGKKKETE